MGNVVNSNLQLEKIGDSAGMSAPVAGQGSSAVSQTTGRQSGIAARTPQGDARGELVSGNMPHNQVVRRVDRSSLHPVGVRTSLPLCALVPARRAWKTVCAARPDVIPSMPRSKSEPLTHALSCRAFICLHSFCDTGMSGI